MPTEDKPEPAVDQRVPPVIEGILDGTIYPHDRKLIRDALDKREGKAPLSKDEARDSAMGRALSGGVNKRQW
jgi:hypothetical protein